MDGNQPTDSHEEIQKPVVVQQTSGVTPPVRTSEPRTFNTVQKYAAIVMIISAILFALIGVLASWSVFGDNTGDVLWRAFSSLGIIAFAALVVNVASRSMGTPHEK